MCNSPISKVPFDEFVKTCAHLLIMPELENQMAQRVKSLLAEALDFDTLADGRDKLVAFMRQGPDFLALVFNMIGISQEKFLRILSAERFAREDFSNEWKIGTVSGKIQKDDDFALHVADILLQGRDNEVLSQKVADFYLQQLSLLDGWESIINSEAHMSRIIRQKLAGEYGDNKGKMFEQIINKTLEDAGIPHDKGQVELVQKEVDHAIPSLAAPRVMIMSCYFETTSSSQTTRANEQRSLFRKICDWNERYPGKPQLVFINIVDGGGWLARRSDLEKMHSSCHYCLNASMLPQLPNIVHQHWQP